MFAIELNRSFLNTGDNKIAVKDIASKWIDRDNMDDKIKIDHIQISNPDNLDLMNMEVRQLSATFKELTDHIKIVKYYITLDIEFEEDDIVLNGPEKYMVLVYQGRDMDLNRANFEITLNNDEPNEFKFKVPNRITNIQEFREYVLSKDVFKPTRILDLKEGDKVLGAEWENGKVTTRLLTVKNKIHYCAIDRPFSYMILNINPVDRITFGTGLDHYVVINGVFVNYGGIY